MKISTYYKYCLIVPVVLPLFVSAVNHILIAIGVYSDILQISGFYLGGSLVVGGLQYLLVALIAWKKLNSISPLEVEKYMAKVPFFYTCVFAVSAILFALVSQKGGFFLVLPIYIFISLAFGYLYFGLSALVFRVLKRLRFVST